MVICLCLTVWGKGPWVTGSSEMLIEFDNLEKHVLEQKKNAVEQTENKKLIFVFQKQVPQR